jgi:hypothetical protein
MALLLSVLSSSFLLKSTMTSTQIDSNLFLMLHFSEVFEGNILGRRGMEH